MELAGIPKLGFTLKSTSTLFRVISPFYVVLGLLAPLIFGDNSIGNCNVHMVFLVNLKYCNCHFPCYMLLTDQMALFGCPYFMRYWARCALQLFVVQSMTS